MSDSDSFDFQSLLNRLAEGTPVLDVRSPKEHAEGHIPGSVSFPLMTNEERVLIGTCYKQEGHEAAVQLGLQLVAPRFAEMVLEAKASFPVRKVVVQCWRGGLRSEIMAWLLKLSGFEVEVLPGGYKRFRNWAISAFDVPKTIVVLDGATGSGKTELLSGLRDAGEQVICLESLAHHSGSAFGGINHPPQPTQEQFENDLAFAYAKSDPNRPLWFENESRSVGKMVIPNELFKLLQTAPMVQMQTTYEERYQRLMRDYGEASQEVLSNCTTLVAKRLGFDQATFALQDLREGNREAWLKRLMVYYDKQYAFGTKRKVETPYQSVEYSIDESLSIRVQKCIIASKELQINVNLGTQEIEK